MYSTLYHPCIVWCMEHMCTLYCMHWFIYLFYLLWGERGAEMFFWSNVDMILIHLLQLYVILFLSLKFLYHDKSLPLSLFCEEGKIFCDSLIWVKEIKIKHFRKMFWCKRDFIYFFVLSHFLPFVCTTHTVHPYLACRVNSYDCAFLVVAGPINIWKSSERKSWSWWCDLHWIKQWGCQG